MQYTLLFRGLAAVLDAASRRGGLPRETRRQIRQEYRAIVGRAADIGSSNRLLGAYGLAAWFIAMTRRSGLSAEDCYAILEKGLAESRLYRAFMGSAKGYFSEKSMASRRSWAKETHQKRYPGDWVVDVVEKGDGFEFGFDYTECGVCKLCRDEGCPELAQYLCRLDYMTTELMGVRLQRTTTLAEGGDRCDFRFSRGE